VNVCLDSWAVLAWLDGDEPARRRVDRIIDRRPVISWVNAVEVYYRIERQHGQAEADEVLRALREQLEFDLPGVARMVETARLKARLPIALPDCFAVATATAHGVPLWTGDHEILDRQDLPCRLADLRP
jgi:predicted nucleic acid-binding protein